MCTGYLRFQYNNPWFPFCFAWYPIALYRTVSIYWQKHEFLSRLFQVKGTLLLTVASYSQFLIWLRVWKHNVVASDPWPALASKRELGEEYKKHILKYVPALRTPLFGLSVAADWLERWLADTLPPPDLLDVHAQLSEYSLWNFIYMLWELNNMLFKLGNGLCPLVVGTYDSFEIFWGGTFWLGSASPLGAWSPQEELKYLRLPENQFRTLLWFRQILWRWGCLTVSLGQGVKLWSGCLSLIVFVFEYLDKFGLPNNPMEFEPRRPITADERKTVQEYVAKSRKRIVHETAAKAWSLGVPWGEALEAATKAVNAAKSASKPLIRKGKGKGRGKRKG